MFVISIQAIEHRCSVPVVDAVIVAVFGGDLGGKRPAQPAASTARTKAADSVTVAVS